MHSEAAVAEDTRFSTISELSRRFGVSLRTLRFYEEKGLLQPKRVGTQRFYAPKDRIRLELILTAKRLGFSLQETENMINAYQQHPESGSVDLVNTLDADTIERQLVDLKQQKATIEAALAELKEALKTAV